MSSRVSEEAMKWGQLLQSKFWATFGPDADAQGPESVEEPHAVENGAFCVLSKLSNMYNTEEAFCEPLLYHSPFLKSKAHLIIS